MYLYITGPAGLRPAGHHERGAPRAGGKSAKQACNRGTAAADRSSIAGRRPPRRDSNPDAYNIKIQHASQNPFPTFSILLKKRQVRRCVDDLCRHAATNFSIHRRELRYVRLHTHTHDAHSPPSHFRFPTNTSHIHTHTHAPHRRQRWRAQKRLLAELDAAAEAEGRIARDFCWDYAVKKSCPRYAGGSIDCCDEWGVGASGFRVHRLGQACFGFFPLQLGRSLQS